MESQRNQPPKLLLWADSRDWSASAQKKFLASFEKLKATQDIRAARGEGASGMDPELQLLLNVTASLVGSGFLGALGADIYEQLKRGLIQASKVAPKITTRLWKYIQALRYRQKPEWHRPRVVLWVDFSDDSLLIGFPVTNPENVKEALDRLPEAVDAYLAQNKQGADRAYWDGKEWQIT